MNGASLEPAAALEHGMLAPQLREPARVLEQDLVAMLPVVPGRLVVLAVGVVVAPLRASDLVAAEQHRDTLRQEEGGHEIASLAVAQSPDRGVASRAFIAAVPGPVVTLAILV